MTQIRQLVNWATTSCLGPRKQDQDTLKTTIVEALWVGLEDMHHGRISTCPLCRPTCCNFRKKWVDIINCTYVIALFLGVNLINILQYKHMCGQVEPTLLDVNLIRMVQYDISTNVHKLNQKQEHNHMLYRPTTGFKQRHKCVKPHVWSLYQINITDKSIR